MSDPERVAWLERRVAESARLVHERDAALAAVDRMRLEVESLRLKHRLASSVTCDRCRAAIAVTSSLAVDDTSSCAALLALATAERWQLSHATLGGLGIVGGPQTSDRDLCPACAAL